MGSRMNQVAVHFADKTLAGVPCLLDDLMGLLEDTDTADILFIVGQEDTTLHAHRIILWARCKNFRKYQREFWHTSSRDTLVTFEYPHFTAPVFTEILHYIYTGKIILQDTTVFETLAISQELGLTELRERCEEHITGTLSVTNACDFLAAAMHMQGLTPELHHGGQSFSDRCAAFIEQRAEDCVKTDGWLRLPKDVLVRLLSSDEFALTEEDVWRAVLRWAKYQASLPLDKPTMTWSEQEKLLVQKALEGVIEHVKLLLVDSTVFAEEVEPTGVVPIELSLERYRFAAVPGKFSQSQDKRLRPRVSLKLFQGTRILLKEKLHFQRLLNTWYGKPKQVWRLLYRATRDGFTADQFHKCCDGIAPTFVIIQGTTGNICGGFSDIPWTSQAPPRGRYIESNRAFLFTLENNQGVEPCRFEVTKPKFATAHHPNYGPMFGAGSDLSVANNCNMGMECYSNLPHSYNGENASCSILMGDYNFNIWDYEVFTAAE